MMTNVRANRYKNMCMVLHSDDQCMAVHVGANSLEDMGLVLHNGVRCDGGGLGSK